MNNYDQMIEVLTAAKNGERIEYYNKHTDKWVHDYPNKPNFAHYDYRIAPKKEMTLVEELRRWGNVYSGLMERAADRIEELEAMEEPHLEYATIDELLDELKRRMK